MKSTNSHQVQRGFYNFAQDSTEGAIGIIGMGVYLPKNAIITRFCIDTQVTGAGGGEATISFGLQSDAQNPVVTRPIQLSPVLLSEAFEAGEIMIGIDFNAQPYKVGQDTITDSAQVVMLIGTAPITAGQWAFTIEYTENNF